MSASKGPPSRRTRRASLSATISGPPSNPRKSNRTSVETARILAAVVQCPLCVGGFRPRCWIVAAGVDDLIRGARRDQAVDELEAAA